MSLILKILNYKFGTLVFPAERNMSRILVLRAFSLTS